MEANDRDESGMQDDRNGLRESREYVFAFERGLASGSLAIAIVVVTQLLQIGPSLSASLTTSLYCFAVSIPLSALDLILLSARFDRKRYQDELSSVDRKLFDYVVTVWGPVVAFIGAIAIFAHFSAYSAVVFGVVSLVASIYCGYCMVHYYPTEPSGTPPSTRVGE